MAAPTGRYTYCHGQIPFYFISFYISGTFMFLAAHNSYPYKWSIPAHWFPQESPHRPTFRNKSPHVLVLWLSPGHLQAIGGRHLSTICHGAHCELPHLVRLIFREDIITASLHSLVLQRRDSWKSLSHTLHHTLSAWRARLLSSLPCCPLSNIEQFPCTWKEKQKQFLVLPSNLGPQGDLSQPWPWDTCSIE